MWYCDGASVVAVAASKFLTRDRLPSGTLRKYNTI